MEANTTNSLFPRRPIGNQSNSIQQAQKSLAFTYNPIPSRPSFWSNASFQFAFIQLLIKLIVQLLSQQIRPNPIVDPNIQPVYGVALPDEPSAIAVYGVAIPNEPQ